MNEECLGEDCPFCESEYTMTASTKRALRTAFHVLVGVAAAVPAAVAGLPSWELLSQVVLVTAAVSKIVNALEDAGVLPGWLKA